MSLRRIGAATAVMATCGGLSGGCGDDRDIGVGRGRAANEIPATPATLARVYAAATGAAVIRLTPGAYGTFRGGRKRTAVTVRGPVRGTATMALKLSGRQRLILDHLHVTTAYLNGARDVTIRRSIFTGMTRVDATARRARILFTHDVFSHIDRCARCYEGRLAVKGDDHPDGVPVGVTVRDSRFGPGGTADGIQIVGSAQGVRIGPGNHFLGLTQSPERGAPHTDPIQLYGSTGTVITGNWLHGNASGIMAPDGSSGEIITNNVIQTTGYPWPIVMGGAHGNRILHNTLPGGGAIEVGRSNADEPSTGVVVRDNVARAVVDPRGARPVGVNQDYNLLAAGALGPHDVRGRPRFAGGVLPRSYAAFKLADRSAGRHRASDARDMGIARSPR
jgi:hypothetical protein